MRSRCYSKFLMTAHNTVTYLSQFSYPAAYTALVLPLSIARWSTFDPSAPPDLSRTAAETPFTATAIVLCIFGLSGIVNVVMFVTTRPNVLGFGARRQARAEKLREKGSGAMISTFGSIGPSGHPTGSSTGDMEGLSMRDGVLIMREITHSSSPMPSPGLDAKGCADQIKSGRTLRFDVVEDSECDNSDVEDDAKPGRTQEGEDMERANVCHVDTPVPAHTLPPRLTDRDPRRARPINRI
jgi:hypothetical protein